MEFDTDSSTPPTPKPAKPLVFRMPDTNTGIESMRSILLERGWDEFEEGVHDEHDWNLWWRAARYRNSDYEDLMPWQRLNHFPKTTAITKKDMLARNMRRMKGVYGGAVYNFTPLAFNLPNDYTKFVAEYTRSKQQQKEEENPKNEFWICKPADSSRGRGIFIFQDLSELTYDCSAVAQRYLPNPLLIAGYKFDLRIYVVVTSFHPLHIYMYQEGIARFSTEKFDLSATGNVFSHLTNTSINKYGPNYSVDKERVGPGCKWSLTMLRNYFHQQNLDDEVLWQRICNIVTLTMLAQAPSVPKVAGSFELFGFDIIIDDNFKPWLLEVNFNPALGFDCSVDYTVKKAMLNDLIDVMGFKVTDAERGGEQFQKLRAKHGMGKKKSTTANFKGSNRFGPRKNSTFGSPARTRNGPLIGKPGGVNRKVAGRKPPGATGKQFGWSNLVSKTEESEDDYDEEVARICGAATSDTNLKSPTSPRKVAASSSYTRQSKLSQREASKESLKNRTVTNSRTSNGQSKEVSTNQSNSFDKEDSETSGSTKVQSELAIDKLSMPNLAEARKALESRKELIRQRQEQKQSSSLSNQSIARQQSNVSNRSSRNSGLEGGIAGSKVNGTIPVGMPRPSNRILRRASMPDHPGQHPTQDRQSLVNGKGRPGQTRSFQVQKAQGDNRQVPDKCGSVGDLTTKPKQVLRQPKPKVKQDTAIGAQLKSKTNPWPESNIGDFVLTFPFNEATKRASYPNLDIRTIIRETQKQLRRTICKAHSTKKVVRSSIRVGVRVATVLGEDSKNSNNANATRFEEGLSIWAPLKSPSLLNTVNV